jgi:hypothetical protein
VLKSERQWKLAEAAADIELVQRDLPLILETLKDAQKAGDQVPVAGGDMSDPTLAAVVEAEEAAKRLDRAVIALHARASELGRLRQSIIGSDLVIRPTEEQTADCCELHRLVLVDDEARDGLQGYDRQIGDMPRNAEGVPPGRRWVTDDKGQTWRLCRWCGDFFDKAGRLPYLVEVRKRMNGQRVHAPERKAS